jgi:HSP20 family protein
MYQSLMSYPDSLFGPFDRLRRELDDLFGVAGVPSSIRAPALLLSLASSVLQVPP